MKKWGFALIICLGLTFIYMKPFAEPKVEIQYGHYKNEKEDRWTTEEIQKEIKVEQIFQGNLLLVNSEHPVDQEGIKSDIVNLSANNDLTQGYVLLGTDIYLSEEIAHQFSEMIAAAGKEGIQNFAITSGFRDFNEQSILFENMGPDYALPPGYSEHNLGLSLDVGSTQMRMADAPEGKWIEENAWKYGFILRYPKDKVGITGIQYEPWHIRYVGFPHSAIMKEKNLVLEEYLEYLKKEENISASVNGERYEISYYPVTENTSIPVPADHYYEVSGNNVDGVIVTVFSS
ncbi:VanY-A/VanY-F/VanY-M family D-Ala-D-Ala carboxypeptidase [Sutcliffiella horikoshii]|uniref:VanY-A/VanY-F/VanY-M family D-Ala-D-Ala carboxypeptidase n=1 Tax=Sutcliffiella horikoshii TaxID=79883 RepID=UPI00384CCCE8